MLLLLPWPSQLLYACMGLQACALLQAFIEHCHWACSTQLGAFVGVGTADSSSEERARRNLLIKESSRAGAAVD
jgi:hypothetical protein